MAKSSTKQPKIRPGLSPESREDQLIALATNLAEKQLMEGTASSQVITHYLKLGSTTEKIRKEILREEKKMIQAKTAALESEKRVEELYSDALKAMRKYSGNEEENDEENGIPDNF